MTAPAAFRLPEACAESSLYGQATDSSEYKMWGNGISLPTALYVMQGIAAALKDGEG